MKYNKIYATPIDGNVYILCLKVMSLIAREARDNITIRKSPDIYNFMGSVQQPTGAMDMRSVDIKIESLLAIEKVTEKLSLELKRFELSSGYDIKKLLWQMTDSVSIEEDIKNLIDNLDRYIKISGSEIIIIGKITEEQEDQLSRLFPMFEYKFC